MNLIQTTFAGLVLMTLGACMTTPPQATTNQAVIPAAATQTDTAVPEQTYLLGWGMFGDPVFDRDVITFENAFTTAYGTPAQSWAYGANERQLTRPDVGNIVSALSDMAARARDGEDLVVVMLTTHGSPDVLALQFERDGPVASVGAAQLVDLLAPLSDDRQILIVQACFSGSLIDDLASPNRIIMTAAAADRSSFGCNPDSDNTWFIKSLNRAMSEGGSWEQIFARTRAYVTSDEAAEGFPSSNPQFYVGANMEDEWTQGAL